MANIGSQPTEDRDAETAPLEDPQFYQYDLDLPEVDELRRQGSVIGSWLVDLSAESLYTSAELEEFVGQFSTSGEGRWTAIAAIEEGVPAPILSDALDSRFSSHRRNLPAWRTLEKMQPTWKR